MFSPFYEWLFEQNGLVNLCMATIEGERKVYIQIKCTSLKIWVTESFHKYSEIEASYVYCHSEKLWLMDIVM